MEMKMTMTMTMTMMVVIWTWIWMLTLLNLMIKVFRSFLCCWWLVVDISSSSHVYFHSRNPLHPAHFRPTRDYSSSLPAWDFGPIWEEQRSLFCFVLFCFVLFCFVLFCFVLFCFVFCFVVLFHCMSFSKFLLFTRERLLWIRGKSALVKKWGLTTPSCMDQISPLTASVRISSTFRNEKKKKTWTLRYRKRMPMHTDVPHSRGARHF